ncbi:MAG: activase [Deltaproteobacteria bacterium]|nr:activase [Deltaproteobacteria bacterium]
MTDKYMGIDLGSTSIKGVLQKDGKIEKVSVIPHDGDIKGTIEKVLSELGYNKKNINLRGVVTGTSARFRINLPEMIAPVALERALYELKLKPAAVVCLGGEDLVVYSINQNGKIASTYSGNKCASGTGEFFAQQLGRMNLTLHNFVEAATDSKIQQISSRCSVFMKSDCTHKLNKGEATPGDIALSLSKVMADKVSDFLSKARIEKGQVVLTGGVTQNPFVKQFIEQSRPELEIVVPKESPYFDAYGAALMAPQKGRTIGDVDALFKTDSGFSYESYDKFNPQNSLVTYISSQKGTYDPDGEYVLGVDGGSTTTKVSLVNIKTDEVVAAYYGRTHGNPVEASKQCIKEIKKQIGEKSNPKITLVATTGSSRELLGVFFQTDAVYNEIIAHTTGTMFFDKEVDTIFEIGGQDAKYVSINNSVPVDYAMNEACSAGTGSFLEESCRGDLNIGSPEDIGPIALKASGPLKYGEHCSAFINSDIRKSIQEGSKKEDIVAGLVFSIVSNYLNRVCGNRAVGKKVAFQGGVAKNPAVPLAFARMTGKEIIVPPDPELMGCFGVAILAKKKFEEKSILKGSYNLDDILKYTIESKGSFVCKSCDNYCTINRLEVNKKKFPFGGRCSKYTNIRRKKTEIEVTDYIQLREKMLFSQFAPDPEAFAGAAKSVGIPMAFSVHSLWPLYSWFFHSLGVRVVPSTSIDSDGIAKIESSYCFPGEIAHGATLDVIKKNTDFIFLPFFKKMPSMEKGPVHATLCPITQGTPFLLQKAFDIDQAKILRPMISLDLGFDDSSEEFANVALQMGFSKSDGIAAFKTGLEKYQEFLKAYKKVGHETIEKIKNDPDTLYITLLGRPYNAFTKDANMGIPRKLISNGVSVIPFDMIFDENAEIFPNMYWYYGQQDMKAVQKCVEIENLYPIWISNFSCAPDSFMLHYLRWMMGEKPYLILEIDSHSADAGIDTRIEAFLDIVESYRKAGFKYKNNNVQSRYSIEYKGEFADIIDHKNGERFDIRDDRVTLIWSSMGEYSSSAISAAAKKSGINSIHLPASDIDTVQRGRSVASGKECIPSLMVLGGMLQYLDNHPPNKKDEILLFYMPSTLGPCRTGQYWVFYERLFKEMGFENVLILVCDSSNSYRELGKTFTKNAWWSIVLGDYFSDLETGLRIMAKDPDSAVKLLREIWQKVLDVFINNGDVEKVVADAADVLKKIPRRISIDELKKVLVVGEIFVRRDDFSIKEIRDFLISKDIFPKVTGFAEWINYTDHCRWRELDEEKSKLKYSGLLTSGRWKSHAWFKVEEFYKQLVEHKIARHLNATGLLPHMTTNMHEIIGNSEKYFLDPRLESEATVSSGAAATGMLNGFDGAVVIAPFACLPGRVVEGLYSPFARKNNYPYLVLENDGNTYSPNIIARMEIFRQNVLRYKK